MKKLISSGAVVLLLAACGGGDDAAPPPAAVDPTVEVPVGASQSSTGMLSYLNALAAADADAKEPVNIDAFDPQKPDDTEPDVVS